MRNHLRTTNYVKNSRPGTGDKRKNSSSEEAEDYSQAFKELFCVAAYDLATMIQEPLQKLGVLYEDIMSTGTLKKNAKAKFFQKNPVIHGPVDVETGTREAISFGKGQLLFVVRETTKLESAQLQAAGFRFAVVSNVIDHLARSIQVTQEELRPRLDSMRKYSTRNHILEPGVHVACFALRPLFQRGFDVLVCRDAKNLLPTVPLPLSQLERWHIDFICRLDNWTVADCLDHLRKSSEVTGMEQEFAAQLYNGLLALTQKLENPFFLEARLTARPLRAPCRPANPAAPPGQAMIIAFRVMTDVHQSRMLNSQVEFTPSRFFLCQQHIYPNSPDHAIFARRIHREFALLNQRREQVVPDTSASTIGPRLDFFHRTPSTQNGAKWNMNYSKRDTSPSTIRNDNSSEKSLVEVVGNPYGGIHVSNEISVDVSEARRGNWSSDVEMTHLGVYSEAGVAPIELESFVDELMGLTIGERRQQK